jgi:hypothetical protein
MNGDEEDVDCGGSCDPCITNSCTDKTQNGDETGVDCGGSCFRCFYCDNGVQDAGETGVDCGDPAEEACPACETCDDGILNQDEQRIADCGGVCGDGDHCHSCDDGVKNGDEETADCGGSCECKCTCDDGIMNCDERGEDCDGSCVPCDGELTIGEINPGTPEGGELTQGEVKSSCANGKQDGDEEGPDCGGSCSKFVPVCPTCFDNRQNGDEESRDCGGSCPACQWCSNGVQDSLEEGVDCGGPLCLPCTSPECGAMGLCWCDKGMGREKCVVDADACMSGECAITATTCDAPGACWCAKDGVETCKSSRASCEGNGGKCREPPSTCDDGKVNGDEEMLMPGGGGFISCGGSCEPCPRCDDGKRNGDETGKDCGGQWCKGCPTSESTGGQTTDPNLDTIGFGSCMEKLQPMSLAAIGDMSETDLVKKCPDDGADLYSMLHDRKRVKSEDDMMAFLEANKLDDLKTCLQGKSSQFAYMGVPQCKENCPGQPDKCMDLVYGDWEPKPWKPTFSAQDNSAWLYNLPAKECIDSLGSMSGTQLKMLSFTEVQSKCPGSADAVYKTVHGPLESMSTPEDVKNYLEREGLSCPNLYQKSGADVLGMQEADLSAACGANGRTINQRLHPNPNTASPDQVWQFMCNIGLCTQGAPGGCADGWDNVVMTRLYNCEMAYSTCSGDATLSSKCGPSDGPTIRDAMQPFMPLPPVKSAPVDLPALNAVPKEPVLAPSQKAALNTICGNAIVEDGEDCDDGSSKNGKPGEKCGADCKTAAAPKEPVPVPVAPVPVTVPVPPTTTQTPEPPATQPAPQPVQTQQTPTAEPAPLPVAAPVAEPVADGVPPADAGPVSGVKANDDATHGDLKKHVDEAQLKSIQGADLSSAGKGGTEVSTMEDVFFADKSDLAKALESQCATNGCDADLAAAGWKKAAEEAMDDHYLSGSEDAEATQRWAESNGVTVPEGKKASDLQGKSSTELEEMGISSSDAKKVSKLANIDDPQQVLSSSAGNNPAGKDDVDLMLKAMAYNNGKPDSAPITNSEAKALQDGLAKGENSIPSSNAAPALLNLSPKQLKEACGSDCSEDNMQALYDNLHPNKDADPTKLGITPETDADGNQVDADGVPFGGPTDNQCYNVKAPFVGGKFTGCSSQYLDPEQSSRDIDCKAVCDDGSELSECQVKKVSKDECSGEGDKFDADSGICYSGCTATNQDPERRCTQDESSGELTLTNTDKYYQNSNNIASGTSAIICTSALPDETGNAADEGSGSVGIVIAVVLGLLALIASSIIAAVVMMKKRSAADNEDSLNDNSEEMNNEETEEDDTEDTGDDDEGEETEEYEEA